jgi:hypothetical protein
MGGGMTIPQNSPMLSQLYYDSRWHYKPSEIPWHINRKEGTAPLQGLQGLQVTLQNLGLPRISNMVWLNKTDNTTAHIYIQKQGGKKTELMLDARKELDYCDSLLIYRISEYLEGDRMITEGADLQSREIYDRQEWQIKDVWFQYLDHLWGPHTVDAFASRVNHVLPRWYSRYPQEGMLGSDCLRFSLSGENVWANPPHVMIPLFLRHIRKYSIRVTLITRAAADAWTPLLQQMSIEPPVFINDPSISSSFRSVAH